MSNKNVRWLYTVILFTLLHINIYAQVPDNATGYPVLSKGYVDVEGSPYLTNDYNKGTVKLADGSTFKDILIKYNQVDDVIYFQGKNNDVLSFVQPVNEFTITFIKDKKMLTQRYKNNYPAVSKNTVRSFYEVLTDGTAQLLKRKAKYIIKNKPYNSSTETQTVNEEVAYYLFVNGKMNLIKKDKRAILAVLSNKQAELEDQIRSNNLVLKNDEDLIRLIVFYNSL